ncbi:MAG TPA: hypothetical protein VFO42_09665 [Sphingomicrobium sp.]|nr:hypothetical protein [Sphingomicrobium sp.]
MTIVRIDRRFRGPPDSANGGYFAGLVARELGGSDVVVTLKRPAPLDRELTIECDAEKAALFDGEDLLALAERAPIEIDVPAPPSFDEAREAERRYTGLKSHIYPGCFVCGPERQSNDGWRIFAGPTGADQVAATWIADLEFAGEDGALRSEFVWAALDCPGYFAVEKLAGLALLGRIGVRMVAPVPCGEPLIVTGWGQGSEGRKHRAATALFDRHGDLLAAATQTWVSLN